ncbi:MBL fold metallo-hydrolase [Actinobacillus porcitonsillarum]|uniref:GloB protein n=2 Tax=Pasteurellaceae TaxID=712 RepID=Q65QZ2_MANSM|nr:MULTISPECIES: MBL fold metallo-hydrolase [Pasteurellaceae]AAU38618.1 GloB protein [[Mannheimia] succiniciproducens MBEL55E]AWI51164.1 MBL fold metallo-hydrolase [Actinobacillus porcitonsillarum]WGE85347.1 MBL fold metallo-hydrolase [Actinobacillus equuli subsp. haemolyticus]
MKKLVLTTLISATLGLSAIAAHAHPTYAPAKNAVKMQKTQVPGYFRQMVGDYEVTALYDGVGNLDMSLMAPFTQFSKAELDAMLDDEFAQRSELGGLEGTIIGFLVNTGDNLILIDAGKGEAEAPIFLDKQGRLIDSLKAAGYQPEQVDIILPTHMHADHINGITEKGKRVFKNATVYLPLQEKAFWLDTPMDKLPSEIHPFIEAARYAVAPYLKADKVKFYNAGDEVFAGVKTVPLFGHTPGHSGFEFTSKGEKILFWGDVMHNGAVQMAHPEVAIEFDADAEAARTNRQTILTKIAADKTLIAAAHLPFPGLGHIKTEKDGKGYRWYPVQYRPFDKH